MGLVLSNYIDMQIEFNWKGQRVTWVGESILSKEPLSKKAQNTLASTSIGALFCRFEYIGEVENIETSRHANSSWEDLVIPGPIQEARPKE